VNKDSSIGKVVSLNKQGESTSSRHTSGPNTCIKVTTNRHSQNRYSDSPNQYDDQDNEEDHIESGEGTQGDLRNQNTKATAATKRQDCYSNIT
jgi:hypothetical protein